SLLVGAISGIACTGTAMIVSDSLAIDIAGGLLIATALTRTILALWLARDTDTRETRSLELAYRTGAFAYALLAGLVAALTVYYTPPGSLQTLTVAYALMYGVGISTRNAGRPPIAIGQLLLATLPILVACTLVGGLANYALTAVMVLMIFGVVSIIFNAFRTLRDQIVVADASARMAERMRELARTDSVTGLLNRGGLNTDALEMLAHLRDERRLALFWIDLDRFKEINDTLGHQVGDRLLAQVANRLRGAAPASAAISRFGGDEFIIVADVADRAESEQLARALADAISRPARIEGHRIDTAASMGVALLPDDGPDMDTLMQGADLALYHAKVGGRNQICFFDNSMTRELVRRKEIEAELRAAIQRDELSIFFQPIVDLETGRIRTFEALVRWFHPEKGELRPDEFIPVAEETGVIITL